MQPRRLSRQPRKQTPKKMPSTQAGTRTTRWRLQQRVARQKREVLQSREKRTSRTAKRVQARNAAAASTGEGAPPACPRQVVLATRDLRLRAAEESFLGARRRWAELRAPRPPEAKDLHHRWLRHANETAMVASSHSLHEPFWSVQPRLAHSHLEHHRLAPAPVGGWSSWVSP